MPLVSQIAVIISFVILLQRVYIRIYIEGNPVSRSHRIAGWGTRTTTKIRDEINQSDQRDSTAAYSRGDSLSALMSSSQPPPKSLSSSREPQACCLYIIYRCTT